MENAGTVSGIAGGACKSNSLKRQAATDVDTQTPAGTTHY
jgi:hypothetical protein